VHFLNAGVVEKAKKKCLQNKLIPLDENSPLFVKFITLSQKTLSLEFYLQRIWRADKISLLTAPL
jgi:hypothetical protein